MICVIFEELKKTGAIWSNFKFFIDEKHFHTFVCSLLSMLNFSIAEISKILMKKDLVLSLNSLWTQNSISDQFDQFKVAFIKSMLMRFSIG